MVLVLSLLIVGCDNNEKLSSEVTKATTQVIKAIAQAIKGRIIRILIYLLLTIKLKKKLLDLRKVIMKRQISLHLH